MLLYIGTLPPVKRTSFHTPSVRGSGKDTIKRTRGTKWNTSNSDCSLNLLQFYMLACVICDNHCILSCYIVYVCSTFWYQFASQCFVWMGKEILKWPSPYQNTFGMKLNKPLVQETTAFLYGGYKKAAWKGGCSLSARIISIIIIIGWFVQIQLPIFYINVKLTYRALSYSPSCSQTSVLLLTRTLIKLGPRFLAERCILMWSAAVKDCSLAAVQQLNLYQHLIIRFLGLFHLLVAK